MKQGTSCLPSFMHFNFVSYIPPDITKEYCMKPEKHANKIEKIKDHSSHSSEDIFTMLIWVYFVENILNLCFWNNYVFS